ncbi:hypothetical protein ACERIT_13170 [Halopenitus sp. H-Gu1]|uniref:hypothetical protein n=1 Tax=Halopenitus sp. H-Gu1 TaxID=3242697 RepID=UPI00359D0BE1
MNERVSRSRLHESWDDVGAHGNGIIRELHETDVDAGALTERDRQSNAPDRLEENGTSDST